MDVSLDDLLHDDDTAEPRRRPARRAGRAAGAAILIAAAVAGLTLPGVAASGLTAREAAAYWNELPDTLPQTPAPQRSTILASDGTTIATFYTQNRVEVPLTQIPQSLRDAVIATEDNRFYDHDGIDRRGILRAAANNALGGHTQGASTLTQQYVKNVLLLSAATDADRDAVAGQSYTRKLREIKYALHLEETIGKDKILEGYLNIAYLGNGAYGVAAAAARYFSTPVSDLTLAQSALLAGLVKDPSGYDPINHPQAARDRRDSVLLNMLRNGKITPEQHTTALAEPLRLKPSTPDNGCTASAYPFYCQYVRESIADDPAFGATPTARQQRLYRGGLTITTALDRKAQSVAQKAVNAAIAKTSRVATAAVTVQPGTGRIVAMAVNRDFGTGKGRTQLLLPALAEYQPGSTFKPITLTAALERGFDLSTVMDAPARYTPAGMKAPDGGFRNAGDSEAGRFDAATATARSSNTWYVKLEAKIGVLAVADMARRLGLTSLPRTGDNAITAQDASLTLGTYEVSPIEMAGVYATFAASGIACRPIAVTSTTQADGTAGPTPDPNCHQAISAGVADTVTSVLTGVIDGPDSHRTGKDLNLGRPAAGKTGTTNSSAAAWFTGYTPQYATAVWVGDPRGGHAHPLTNITANGRHYAAAYGGTVAGPIWKAVMTGLHQGHPVRRFPPASPAVTAGATALIPDVRATNIASAAAALHAAGLTVRIADTTGTDPLYGPGVVVTQNPAAGSRAIPGAPVTLTLSTGSRTDLITD